MNVLDRLLDWATSRAYRPDRVAPEPLDLDAAVARERRATAARRRQHAEEMRQLALIEVEVAALRADAEVIGETYSAPYREGMADGDRQNRSANQGHQPA